MRLPRLRVRTHMLLVGVVALLVWTGMMGLRWYDYSRRRRSTAFRSAIVGRTRNVISLGARREPSRRDGACRSPTTTQRWCGSIAARCGARGSPSTTSPRSSTPTARPLPRSLSGRPTSGNPPERAAENLPSGGSLIGTSGIRFSTSSAVRNLSSPARTSHLQSLVSRAHAAAGSGSRCVSRSDTPTPPPWLALARMSAGSPFMMPHPVSFSTIVILGP